VRLGIKIVGSHTHQLPPREELEKGLWGLVAIVKLVFSGALPPLSQGSPANTSVCTHLRNGGCRSGYLSSCSVVNSISLS
jgi:hypothetical protein